MTPRRALTVAIVAGALAILLVILDTVFSLEVRLETRDDGDWSLVAESPYRDVFGTPERGFGCAGRDLRIIVDNHRPFATNVRVQAGYFNHSAGREEFPIDETWHLAAFSGNERSFTVPAPAFEQQPPDNATAPKLASLESTDVQIIVGSLDPIFACVNRGA